MELVLDAMQLRSLREVLRPFSHQDWDKLELPRLCERLYDALYKQETTKAAVVSVAISATDALLINQYVSSEDGDWAEDVLRQTRVVLHWLRTGCEPVYLAEPEDVEAMLAEWPIAPVKRARRKAKTTKATSSTSVSPSTRGAS